LTQINFANIVLSAYRPTVLQLRDIVRTA